LFHTEQEALCASEPVHTIWSREKSLFAAGIQTPFRAACSPASIDRTIPAPTQVPFTTLIYATASSLTLAESFFSKR